MVGWKALALLAIVVAAALGAFAAYTFGWRENNTATATTVTVTTSRPKPKQPSPLALTPKRFTALPGSQWLYTIHGGDVVRLPGTSTLCQATGEAGQPRIFCTHKGRTRFQVVFTADGVRVYDLRPPNEAFVPDYFVPGELR